MNITTYMIDDKEAFVRLQSQVSDFKYDMVALDVETDSTVEKKANLYGVGLCFEDNEAFYIPIRKNTGELWWDEATLKEIYAWIYATCIQCKMIGWNLIYDVLVLESSTGYDFSKLIHADGILEKHLVDEERPFGLKEVAVRYLGPWADRAQQAMKDSVKKNGGRISKENFEMFKADTDILGDYCGYDVVLTWKLHAIFSKRIKEEGLEKLWLDEVLPLYKEVTINMKRQGFNVDVQYYESLKVEITKEAERIEDEILSDVAPLTAEFVDSLLNEEYPLSTKGNFPKMFCDVHCIPAPTKNDKVSLTKKAIREAQELYPDHGWFYDWLLSEGTSTAPAPADVRRVQEHWFYLSNPERRSVFNLKSNDHLAWLLFTKLGETPTDHTETGKPKCDEDYLDSVKDRYPWVAKLIDLKKMLKLLSTYVEGILERQVDGVIYTSFLMFGTTSGRFSSTNPNLQNIPRVKDEESDLSPLVLKYTNAIKRGLVPPAGYKIVNADYSSLEPVCFAHMSGDEKLRDVFRKGYDLYSQIAIDVFGITGCSANKKDKNYLKNLHPELRQKAKVFCLAVVYGAEAGRISQAMGVDYQTASEIIENYLDAYPELRNYMQKCDHMATKYGLVKTEFGRVRHLPKAKELYARYGEKLIHNRKWVKERGLDDTRYVLKNAMNNAKNYCIQGLAAHIVNRAMIATQREFRKNNLEAHIVAMVHDEITCVAREDQADIAKQILKECMENTTKISVPLQAEPIIGANWSEAK